MKRAKGDLTKEQSATAGSEKIALVLQGGGALGSYQAGAYAALERGGVSPE